MFLILDTNKDEKLYFNFFEKQFIAEASSFLDGMTWILGLYNMFNTNYPKRASLTLEFLEMYCLKGQSNIMRGLKKNFE